jgi:hypothetical protein
MPGVFETISFLVISAQAGSLGAGLSAVFGGFSGILGTVASVGLSYLSSLLTRQKQPKPEDVQTEIRNATAPRQRHYGRVKTSGTWVFAEGKDGNFHKVLALGTGLLDAIEEYWVDDRHVAPDGDGLVPTAPFDNGLYIHSKQGLPTETHYWQLTAHFPEWNESYRGDGVSSLYILQLACSDELSERFPRLTDTQYRVVARGSRVYNPSNGLTEWSDNAAAVIRDYMSHADGMHLPWALFNTTQATAGWLAAYNKAEEGVTLATQNSPPDSPLLTEKRYRLWGTYTFDERPADVLGRMLACCDARPVPTPDGGLTIEIGDWAEPTVVIDEGCIVGFTDFRRGRDIMATANVISATYLSPDHDYQAQDAERWEDTSDIAERGEIVTDRAFNMAPSHSQCRRLMKLEAYRANPRWVGTFECNLRGLAAFGKRFVRIQYPLFEIDEVFEVEDFRFNIGEGNILRSVTIQVHSMPSSAYSWTASEEEGESPRDDDTTVDRTIPVPEDVSFTEALVLVAGQVLSVGVAEFAAPPSAALLMQVQYRKVGDTAWLPIAVVPGETSAQTGVLEDGEDYEARFRHITLTGREGEWTDEVPLSPTSFVLGAGDDFVLGAGDDFILGFE